MSGSKEDIYELFGSEQGVSPELDDKTDSDNRDSALLLYDLDFSVGEPTPDAAENEKISNTVIPRMAAAAVVDVVEIRKQESEEEVDIHAPGKISLLSQDVLSHLLEDGSRVGFSLLDAERISGPMTKVDRWRLKRHWKQLDDVFYFGNGVFGLNDRLAKDIDWEDHLNRDGEKGFEWLAGEVIAAVAETNPESIYAHEIKQIIKKLGYNLFLKEKEALIDRFEALTGVMVNRDTPDNILSSKVSDVSEDPEKVHASPDQPFVIKNSYTIRSPRDIGKAMNAINRSDEHKRAVDRATNKANNRRHGHNFRRKGSKAQGKRHGKKVSFEQLLKQSIASAPKAATTREITKDGNAES